MNIKKLKDKEMADKIANFLTSKDAFDQTWAPNEKQYVREAVFKSLDNDKHQYWYAMDGDKIIAAAGVNENKLQSGGYTMDEDFISVHKDYRKSGLGSKLLKRIEKFVQDKGGRYVHIISCDIDSYIPAHMFFVRNGYRQVGAIPNYYVDGEGRLDFIKEL